jgi:hypothetical protein
MWNGNSLTSWETRKLYEKTQLEKNNSCIQVYSVTTLPKYFSIFGMDRSNFLYSCFRALPEQSLSGLCPTELTAAFYCLIWDSPNLEGQVPVVISPRNRVVQVHPRALGSLFVASYDSQGYGGVILTRLHTEPRVPPLLNGVLIGLLQRDGLRIFEAVWCLTLPSKRWFFCVR